MKGIKVLLVDDEVEFTAGLGKVLTRRGFEVDIAADGLAALPMIAQKAYDVVVLDVKMPGMDGMHVLSEVKRLAPATRVVMLTGHYSLDGHEEESAAGAFAYLLKPCPIMKLVDVILAASAHAGGCASSEIVS